MTNEALVLGVGTFHHRFLHTYTGCHAMCRQQLSSEFCQHPCQENMGCTCWGATLFHMMMDWHHMLTLTGCKAGIMSSQTTDNSTDYKTARPVDNKRNIKAPSQRPVMWKAFPCDLTMGFRVTSPCGRGYYPNFLPSAIFSVFQNYQNAGYLLNIRFIFDTYQAYQNFVIFR